MRIHRHRGPAATTAAVAVLITVAAILGSCSSPLLTAAHSLPRTRTAPSHHVAPVPPIDWSSLTAGQLFNLTLLQVSASSADDIAALRPNACAGWQASQLSVLQSQCSGFSTTCIANITAPAIVGIQADCANALLTQAVEGFSAPQLTNLQPAAWAALTSSSISGLSQSACAALTPTAVAALGSNTAKYPTTSDACQGVSPQCVLGAPSNAFSQLTQSCGGDFQIPIFSILTPVQLGNLSASVFAVLNAEQLGALGVNCAGMQPGQITQLPDDGQGASSGQPQMCKALQPNCVEALSPKTIGAIQANCAGDLVFTAFSGFSAPQLAAFNLNGTGGLVRDEIAALPSGICDALSADQIAVLGTLTAPFDACSGFTGACMSTISAAKFSDLMPTCFSFLQPSAFVQLAAEQITAVTLPAIRGMSAAQLAQLPSSSCAGFTPNQVELLGSISPYDTCAGFSLDCLQALTPAAFGELTSTCYSFIPSTYISSFSFQQVTSISPSSVSGVTAPQLVAWTGKYNAELIGSSGGVWASPIHTADLTAQTILGFKSAIDAGQIAPNFTLTAETTNVVTLSSMTSLQLAYCTDACFTVLLSSGAAGALSNLLFLPLSTYRGLRGSQLSSVSPTIFAQFSTSVLGELLQDAIEAVTPEQIGVVQEEAFQAINLGQLSVENGAIAALTQALIQSIPEQQWTEQLQCRQYNNMTAQQREWMGTAESVFSSTCSGGEIGTSSSSSTYSQTTFLAAVLGGIGGTFLLCVVGYFACLRPRYLHELSQTSSSGGSHPSDRGAVYHGGRMDSEHNVIHEYSGSTGSLSRSMSGSSKSSKNRRMGQTIKSHADALRQPLAPQSHIAPGSSPILVGKPGTSQSAVTPPYTQQDVAQAHLDDSDDDFIGSRF
jgi:hypothetical protein